MPLLDWIFVAVLALSLLLGAWRGLLFEVLSLASWIAAFFLARWFALDGAQLLPMTTASESLRYAAGFAAIFIATILLGGLIAVLVKKLASSIGLRPIDRLLGAVFGLMRGVLLMLLATALAALTPLKTGQLWHESIGIRSAVKLLQGLQPALAPALGRYLPA